MKSKNQDPDKNILKIIEDFKAVLVSIITLRMYQINMLKYSPAQKDSTKPHEPTTMVQAKRRAPPLDGENSTKIGDMWTLKHEISSQTFFEIFIKA